MSSSHICIHCKHITVTVQSPSSHSVFFFRPHLCLTQPASHSHNISQLISPVHTAAPHLLRTVKSSPSCSLRFGRVILCFHARPTSSYSQTNALVLDSARLWLPFLISALAIKIAFCLWLWVLRLADPWPLSMICLPHLVCLSCCPLTAF